MSPVQQKRHARTASWAALALALAACSSAFAGPVLIVRSERGSIDNPTTQAVANLSAQQAAAGNSVTVVTALPASLVGYSQVWDLAFRDALSGASQSAYLAYLQQGGKLALIGDNNSLFSAHNQGIRDIITAAGGGDVGSQDSALSVPQTLRAPFAGAGLLAQPFFLAVPAYFDNPGSGSWMLAQADDDLGSGVAFDVGDLSSARMGTLLSVLDIDIFGDVGNSTAQWHAMTDKLLDFMTNSATAQVPEPPVLALVALALLGAAWRSRGRASRAALDLR